MANSAPGLPLAPGREAGIHQVLKGQKNNINKKAPVPCSALGGSGPQPLLKCKARSAKKKHTERHGWSGGDAAGRLILSQAKSELSGEVEGR